MRKPTSIVLAAPDASAISVSPSTSSPTTTDTASAVSNPSCAPTSRQSRSPSTPSSTSPSISSCGLTMMLSRVLHRLLAVSHVFDLMFCGLFKLNPYSSFLS
ncbi:hypothetical protein L596_024427 [Steinernema carpocapsae]|uniref:Uncharacterized protein n=1 Tax=Steinernema carpocapsae TaxID=34508 RepID=A0A4U5MGQ1_STECR|nr:hypothetical protein L596_024427 [Steinernema carpocapsae]